MSSRNFNRYAWKRVLASVVVGLSATSSVMAQERGGRLRTAILDRFDTDGDGQLSPKERERIGNRFRREADSKASSAEVPAKLKSLYKATSGPHPVEVAQLKLTSSSRTDPLQVRVTYPKSTGQFPVIVFAHGAFGSKDAYDPIVRHWVSNGYVVIQGTHGDSISLMSKAEKMRLLASGDLFAGIGKHWKTRCEDVALIVESLKKIQTLHAPLRGKIDSTRVGIGGHSYGSNTTLACGGMNLGIDLKIPDVKALLLLSPPGPNEAAQPRMYKNISAPSMVVTGTNDVSPRMKSKGHEWRTETYELIPSSPKYLLFIDEAEHSLGGISGVEGAFSGGKSNASHLTYVKSASIAFWDAHVKSDTKALAFLKSDQILKTSSQDAKLTFK